MEASGWFLVYTRDKKGSPISYKGQYSVMQACAVQEGFAKDVQRCYTIGYVQFRRWNFNPTFGTGHSQ